MHLTNRLVEKVGRSVGRSVGQKVGRSEDLRGGRSVGQKVGRLEDLRVDRLEDLRVDRLEGPREERSVGLMELKVAWLLLQLAQQQAELEEGLEPLSQVLAVVSKQSLLQVLLEENLVPL